MILDWLFGKSNKGRIGIDLGVSAVKILEFKKSENHLILANYALTQTKDENNFKITDLSEMEIAKILKDLIVEAKIEGRRANISLPINQTFSTIIDFPEMNDNELAAAVPFEAKKYVPVSLDEVILDWNVVGRIAGVVKNNSSAADIKKSPSSQNGTEQNQIQVLLVAIPKEVIAKISKIAKLANLEISSLEQEAFSLARSLVGDDKSTFLIIDIGRRSTDLVVVDEGSVRLSHNLETIDKEVLIMEIDRLVNMFRVKYNKIIGTCLLTGGRAREKNIADFLTARLPLPVVIGNPFAKIAYPPALEPALRELGSQLAVAAGLAMRE